MKKHFVFLFDQKHRWWTFSFFITSVLLITASVIIGITDNTPGLISLFLGMSLLILSLVHTWKSPANFGIFAGVCAGIIALIFLGLWIWAKLFFKAGEPHSPNETEGVLEAVIMLTILFICLPGIFVGIVGAIYRAVRKK